MKLAIKVPHGRIAAFCRRWQIRELALFGSVLRGEFGPVSLDSIGPLVAGAEQ